MQLNLAFPDAVSYLEEDFFIGSSNEQSYRLVKAWPQWTSNILLVWGESGCGKTHLSHIFARHSGAVFKSAAQASSETVVEFFAGHEAVILEDLPGSTSEATLFHLVNYAKEAGRYMLLTSDKPPVEWKLRLADLSSRLNAAMIAEISAPDDELMKAMLVKMFSDKQIHADSEVVEYIARRAERSPGILRKLVGEISEKMLSRKANLTLPVVRGMV